MKNQSNPNDATPALSGGPGSALTDEMAAMAELGFCIVLKCLPDGFPWFNDDFSEASTKKWVAHAQYVKTENWRHSEMSAGDTPAEALLKLADRLLPNSVSMEKPRNSKPASCQ